MYIDMVFLNKNQMREKPYTLKLLIGGKNVVSVFGTVFSGERREKNSLQGR